MRFKTFIPRRTLAEVEMVCNHCQSRDIRFVDAKWDETKPMTDEGQAEVLKSCGYFCNECGKKVDAESFVVVSIP